ncbi:MAG: hypothetical protein ACLP1X_20640 [Polyangiaceae bacterium]
MSRPVTNPTANRKNVNAARGTMGAGALRRDENGATVSATGIGGAG